MDVGPFSCIPGLRVNQKIIIIIIIMDRRLRMTNAERSRLHRRRNRFCRNKSWPQYICTLPIRGFSFTNYRHHQFVEFPVTSPAPQAHGRRQPEIRPEPQRKPHQQLNRKFGPNLSQDRNQHFNPKFDPNLGQDRKQHFDTKFDATLSQSRNHLFNPNIHVLTS